MSVIFFFALFGVSFSAATEQFVEAAVGTTVTLPCRTDQTSSIVVWNHFPFGAILSNIVYLNGDIYDNYRGRFTVPGSRFGVNDLIISRVGLEDSGKYTCTIGNQLSSLELIVLELYPSPQSCSSNSSGNSVIGRNSCGIDPETVRLNCTLRYQGNILPVLDWGSSTDASVASRSEAIDSKTTVSTVILKAGEHKRATYWCFIKYFNASLVSNFNCSLEFNVITLFSQTLVYSPDCSTTEPVSCSVNATVTDCSYTWTNNKSEEIASGSTLFLQKHQKGQYTCKADCVVPKNRRCVFEPVKVNNTCAYGKTQDLGAGAIAGIVIGVAVPLIGLIIVVFFILNRKLCVDDAFKRDSRPATEIPHTSLNRNAKPSDDLKNRSASAPAHPLMPANQLSPSIKARDAVDRENSTFLLKPERIKDGEFIHLDKTSI